MNIDAKFWFLIGVMLVGYAVIANLIGTQPLWINIGFVLGIVVSFITVILENRDSGETLT